MRNYIIWNFHAFLSVDCELGVNKLQPKKTFQMMFCLIYITFFFYALFVSPRAQEKTTLGFKSTCCRQVKAWSTHKLKKFAQNLILK